MKNQTESGVERVITATAQRHVAAVMDIETGPLPMEELEKRMPKFEASKVLKDPVKIEADIAAKRQEWLDGAALSALTGRVLVIGILDDGDVTMIEGDEADILRRFWSSWNLRARPWVTHNGIGFDFPFIIRRSFMLGVDVPYGVRRGRYLSDMIVDTMQVWACGIREMKMISLDALARAMGMAGKSGSGGEFAKTYASDREAALEYLENDLRLTWAVAERMGLL